MSIVVNTNLASLAAQRNLSDSTSLLSKSMERLASGMRINRAADDAAGMAISQRMSAQIRSFGQAERNTMDAISLVQVAEGAYNETGNILIRLRELSIESANGTFSSTDRLSIQAEADRLVSELTGIANSAKFNNVILLGTAAQAGNTIVFQVGISTIGYTVSSTDQFAVTLYALLATNFTSSNADLTALALTTASNAQIAISTLDTAINNMNNSRAQLGAAQVALESRTRSQTIMIENLTAAQSRIRDADVAKETSELVRNQILVQAGTAVLSQANQLPQLALSLLRA
jgi:flagellin